MGASGWFLRLNISGIFPRRVGPFSTKEETVELLEGFVSEVVLGSLLDIQNGMDGNQACVAEGVRRLVASAQRKHTS